MFRILSKVTKKFNTYSKFTLNDIGGFERTSLSNVFFPRTTQNIQQILKKAKLDNKYVCVRGTNHTMGGHTLVENGYLLDMKFCNQISYNKETKRVTVETGAHWSDVIRTLNEYGRSPIVLQSYCSFSVGGTLSVNAHGISNDKTMSESVISFKIITHTGEILNCSREENKELFSLAIGGYGLFGVVFSVELETTENKKLDLEVIGLKREEFIEPYKRILQDPNVNIKIVRFNITDFDKSTAYIFREKSTNSVISKLSYKPKQYSAFSKLFYKWVVPTSIFQNFRYKMESYFQKPLDFNKYEDRNQILYEDASQLSKLYNPFIKVNDTFILQEYFVPEENLVTWWKEFENLNKLKDSKITLLNATLRYVYQDQDSFLKYSPENSFAIVLYFRISNTEEMDQKLGEFQKKMIQLTLDKNGTFYLPYRKYYTETELLSSYPNWKDFILLKKKYDPYNLFSNKWFEKYSQDEKYYQKIDENLVNETPRFEITERVKLNDSFVRIFHSNSQYLRENFREFINNVFHISHPSFLQSLIQAAIVKSNAKNDHEIYEKLLIEYQKFSWILNFKLVQALRKSKNQIGGELLEVLKYLGIQDEIRSFASVGDFGKINYLLQKNLPNLERNIVIHDKLNKMNLILESGGLFFNPEFKKFNYENVPSFEDFKVNNLD